MHQALASDFKTESGVFPVIRSGNRADLTTISNTFGISNHNDGDEEWVKAKINNNAIDWHENTVKPGITPDVTGMTLRDAIYVLETCGYRVRVQGNGRVVKQSIMPGRKLNKGDKINIELG